jgi:hypothetical protein
MYSLLTSFCPHRNSNACFQEQIDFYMAALQKWDLSLDPTLTWFPQAPPAVYQLR